MKIVAIVQARIGSTRLPGKVMKTILGKPVILWDIDRISSSMLIDETVIAIPYGEENDIIESTVRQYNNKITVARGSENDVLDRYYKAAVQAKADIIIRITSDCPLIDPTIIDKVIEEFLTNGCDYCSNTLELTYPRGMDTEIFTFKALEKAWKEAKEDYEREHVTPYIREHPDIFKQCNVSNEENLSHLRLTLDTPEDFELITEIYCHLHPTKKMFLLKHIQELFNKRPDLIKINEHIMQKAVH
ncbi:cytidylyltransferase domain-containing protein [Methanolobus profundi]|uniref:Spore coat polysaccharide biosynthesis protein SpsF n=1 Tax=Methanolobus profundi TaxID=487685 RepID=A0A1I4UJC7_9EURY|nr:glycosyltransferase family protein [Methanolobus profundi]SFM89084.1 spore coat polysaccharide biosynthesis protein SpsF [Methanolobus profundi]